MAYTRCPFPPPIRCSTFCTFNFRFNDSFTSFCSKQCSWRLVPPPADLYSSAPLLPVLTVLLLRSAASRNKPSDVVKVAYNPGSPPMTILKSDKTPLSAQNGDLVQNTTFCSFCCFMRNRAVLLLPMCGTAG